MQPTHRSRYATFLVSFSLTAALTITAAPHGNPAFAAPASAGANPAPAGTEPVAAAPAGPPSVRVDCIDMRFDVDPLIVDGRILVPFRGVAEAMGVKVEWIQEARQVVATSPSAPHRVELTVGDRSALVNGIPQDLEVSPRNVGGRVLIPLRFFSEAFGCRVEWDGSRRVAAVFSPPSKMEVLGYYALGDERTSSWKDLFGAEYPGVAVGLTDRVGTVSFGWYGAGADGSLSTTSRAGFTRPDGWEEALQASAGAGLATEMMVFAGDGDGSLSSLLGDKQARARLVEAVKAECGAFGGVNLDFEGLGMSGQGEDLDRIRREFCLLAQEISGALKPLGKRLTITVHAPNSAYRGYDYGRLGSVADRIVIMAYGYGATGPEEPVDKVIEALGGLGGVPKEKVLLGISLAGESGDSVTARVALARRASLAGVALWRLGLAGDLEEEALRASILPAR